MPVTPMDATVAAWKRQIDIGLRIAEAFVEGAEKARKIQLSAAADAHVCLEANRKALAGEVGPSELVSLQARLATENLARMAEYWNRLAANARDTQARIVQILTESVSGAQAALPFSVSPGMVDSAYQEWIDSLKRFYNVPRTAQADTA